MAARRSLSMGNHGGLHSQHNRRFLDAFFLKVEILDFMKNTYCEFSKCCQGKMEIDRDIPNPQDILCSWTICYLPLTPLLFVAHQCLHRLLRVHSANSS